MKKTYSISTLLLIVVLFGNPETLYSQSSKSDANSHARINKNSDNDFGDLVWSDEFDGTGIIDTSKWFHQTKLPNGTSWWNGEIQHYTNRIVNSFVDSGYLHIVARKEEFTDQGVTKLYTSARLNSKFAFTYGKVEIRAILPTGQGTWPAMWTLGKNITENGGYWFTQGFGTTGWPACGEIDIMEHWGSNQDYVSSALHTPSSYGNTSNKGGRTVPDVSTDFHIYSLEWTPDEMVFSVNSTAHYTYNPAVKDASTWPFDKDQYILLNIAILPEISDAFTQSPMIIDYVRVYEYQGETYLRNNKKSQVRIYPNPAADMLSIEIDRPVSCRIKIHSTSGKMMYSKQLENNPQQLDLSFLPNGLYYITVEGHEFLVTKQLVKH